jgi:hypothetical protein
MHALQAQECGIARIWPCDIALEHLLYVVKGTRVSHVLMLVAIVHLPGIRCLEVALCSNGGV